MGLEYAMATKKARRSAVPHRRAFPVFLRVFLIVGVLAVFGLPVLQRGLWRWNERSAVGAAVDAVRGSGCLACHMTMTSGLRWRGGGDGGTDLSAIDQALAEGRPAVVGLAGPMPSYAKRVSRRELERLRMGAAVFACLAGVPDDPELRTGLQIAREMGCFDCHGPLGAGGVSNPGTVGGRVPGFYGRAFAREVETVSGIETVVRQGRPAKRAWWSVRKRPPLDMPAYGDRLDSVEIQLVVYAVQTLGEDLGDAGVERR